MFTKPNSKNIASVAVTGGAFVIGAKFGDGIAAVVPDSMASYKRYILAALGILGAACVDGKTTMGQASQSALIGLGAKQLYDELSDALADAVPVKEATSSTNKFVNAIVSTSRPALVPTSAVQQGVAAPWLGQPSNDDIWDRASFEEAKPLPTFTGV